MKRVTNLKFKVNSYSYMNSYMNSLVNNILLIFFSLEVSFNSYGCSVCMCSRGSLGKKYACGCQLNPGVERPISALPIYATQCLPALIREDSNKLSPNGPIRVDVCLRP